MFIKILEIEERLKKLRRLILNKEFDANAIRVYTRKQIESILTDIKRLKKEIGGNKSELWASEGIPNSGKCKETDFIGDI